MTAASEIEPSYPIYILQHGDNLRVVFPDDRQDIGHTDFWEQTVSYIVARHYGIPQKKLANLPYCQRRARVVGDRVFVGTRRPDAGLLKAVRVALGNDNLTFAYDEHERRLREDVRQFRRLVSKQAK